MATITAEEFEKTTGQALRAEARRAPVEVTYQGRAELVVMSAEDYALLRSNRRIAFRQEEMPAGKRDRIAGNRMDAGHAGLDSLMDD